MDCVAIILLAFIFIVGVSAQGQNDNNLPIRTRECYTCSNCKNVTNSTARKHCPINPLEPSPQPKCISYVEKFKDFKEPRYIRGCVTERGNCKDLNKINGRYGITIQNCKECYGDRCNFDTMTKSYPKIITFCSLIIVPLLKVYTLG